MTKESLNTAEIHPDDQNPETGSVLLIEETEIQETDPLVSAVEAYQNQPHTPELITQTLQAVWSVRGEIIGQTYEITPCPLTKEEIAYLEASGQRLSFLPPELAGQRTRHKLGKIFPQIQSHGTRISNPITNNQDRAGWFAYESSISAPHTNMAQEEIENAARNGLRRLTLNQYIVAGQDSKLFTGSYLDERRTWSNLDSFRDFRIVNAHFYPKAT